MAFFKIFKWSLFLVCLLFFSVSQAATKTWTGGGANKNWSTAANWAGGVVPGMYDDVVIKNVTSANKVLLTANTTTLRSLTVENAYIDCATFTINVSGMTGMGTYLSITSSSNISNGAINTSLQNYGLVTNSTFNNITFTIYNGNVVGYDDTNQATIVSGCTFTGTNAVSLNMTTFKLSNNTFSGPVTVTSNLPSGINSMQNVKNTFNGAATLINNSGSVSFGNGDLYTSPTAQVTVTNNAVGGIIYIALSTTLTATDVTFSGPVTFNNTNTGKIILSNTVSNKVNFTGAAARYIAFSNSNTGEIIISNLGEVTFTYSNIYMTGSNASGKVIFGSDPLSTKKIKIYSTSTFNIGTGGAYPPFTAGIIKLNHLEVDANTLFTLGASVCIDIQADNVFNGTLTSNAYCYTAIGGTYNGATVFNLLSGAVAQTTDTYHSLTFNRDISIVNKSVNDWNIGGNSTSTTTPSNNTVSFNSQSPSSKSNVLLQAVSSGYLVVGYNGGEINFTSVNLHLRRSEGLPSPGSIKLGLKANVNIDNATVPVPDRSEVKITITTTQTATKTELGSSDAGTFGTVTFYGTFAATGFSAGVVSFGRFNAKVPVTFGTITGSYYGAIVNLSPYVVFEDDVTIKCQGISGNGGYYGASSTFERLSPGNGTYYFRGSPVFNGPVTIKNSTTTNGGFIFGYDPGDVFNFNSNVTIYKNTGAGNTRTSATGISHYKGDYNYYGIPDATAMAGQSIFDGSLDQSIWIPAVGATLRFNLLEISKPIPPLPALPTNVIIGGLVNVEGSSGELKLISGNIKTTTTNLLTIDNGSIITGGNAISFVEGPLKKIGSIPTITPYEFKFHIGKTSTSGSIVTNIYMPVSITMPLDPTSTYTAEFFNATEPMGNAMVSSTGIRDFNRCQYWTISHTGPNENIAVSLPWDNTPGQTCYPVNPNVVCVAEYSIGQWLNMGSNTTVIGNKGIVKSNILNSQLTGPYIYFTIGYRNALVLNTIQSNPSLFKVLSHTESLPDKFVSGPSGTPAGDKTAVAAVNNVPGKIVIHPDFGSDVDVKIDQTYKDPLLASIDPKADALTYESLDMKLYTNASAAVPVCTLVTAKEVGTTYTPLSDQYHSKSGNAINFFKQRQEAATYELSNSLSDGITFPVNVSGVTTPFQINNVPAGVTLATLDVKDVTGTVIYTTTSNPLNWDGKASGSYVAQGVYSYELTLTVSSQNYVYKGQLIVKYQ